MPKNGRIESDFWKGGAPSTVLCLLRPEVEEEGNVKGVGCLLLSWAGTDGLGSAHEAGEERKEGGGGRKERKGQWAWGYLQPKTNLKSFSFLKNFFKPFPNFPKTFIISKIKV